MLDYSEAPVYCAPIVTRGGAISGYCSSGRVNSDKAPASMVTMANTHAKMGRLIKNCAMVCAPFMAGALRPSAGPLPRPGDQPLRRQGAVRAWSEGPLGRRV